MSSELDERLARCFRAVFPDLAAELVPGASSTSVDGWDSLATVVLIATVEEEFGVRITADRFPELRSYRAIRAHLAGPSPG